MSLETQTPVSGFGYTDSLACEAAGKLQSNVIESWKKELVDRINIYDGSKDKFIRTFVPSRARCTFNASTNSKLKDAFAKWTPVAGQEVESYGVLLKGLDTVVKPFPKKSRLSFFRSHAHEMKFPFTEFASNHHNSYPDLAASLPGVELSPELAEPTWTDFSMVIEAKATAADDPFTSNSLKNCKAVVQLAVSARSLMHAHGLLATYVLGFYGDIARIARFDHACAVVSKPFSLKKLDDLKLLQRFFWRFVNPCDSVPFVGCDPTIRKLDSDDEKWLKELLHTINFPVATLVLREARRAEVFDDDNDGQDLDAIEPKPYIMFKALDVNGRLFSRATTVWLGIRDTRQSDANAVDGGPCEAEDAPGEVEDAPSVDEAMDTDPSDDGSEDAAPKSVYLRIIKDAWRQLVRRPENEFYDLLDETILPEERVGLATLLGGGDLGEREVRQWENALYGNPTPSDEVDHKTRLSAQKTADADDVLAKAPKSMLVTGQGTSSKSLPAHRPMQQTFSWRLSRGDDQWHKERSHMRFVVDTVGRSLTNFRSTRELVEAMFDAIRGHKLAMEKAGVLHRDISVGNVLIVDDPDAATLFRGFIHDFDYSSCAMDVDDAPLPELIDDGGEPDYDQIANGPDGNDDAQANLKERTGTYYFMAIQLLQTAGVAHEVYHELESFYWVLLWVVLRHTDHKHALKEKASADIFKYGEDRLAAGQKIAWLQDESKVLGIKGNTPLTALLDKYKRLVARSVFTKEEKNRLTYEAVEKLFRDALDDNRWPVNDAAKTFVLPDPRTRTVVVGLPNRKPRTASRRSVPAKQKQPVPGPAVRSGNKRKSQAAEEPTARRAQRPRRAAAPQRRGKRG